MERKFDLVGDKDSASTTKKLSVEEIEAICSYFNTFHMYCENDTIERLKRLREKLAYKGFIFKFDGSHYGIFSLDQFARTAITGYKLTLEQVEQFADRV